MSNQSAGIPSSKTRQRLDHIDVMRPIKQVAVISTHTLLFFAPVATSLVASSSLLLTHFSRYAFFFVSACMLTYSLRDAEQVNWWHYTKRRFRSIGIPYLAWTVIYFFYNALYPKRSFPYVGYWWSSLFGWSGSQRFFNYLFTGFYHLYFLLVLVQFYVLFPFIFRFVKRYRQWILPLLVLSLAWQIVLGYGTRFNWANIHLLPQTEARMVFSYAFYLLGGVVAAFYLDAVHRFVTRHQLGVLLGTLAAAAVGIELNVLSAHQLISASFAPTGDPFAPIMIPYVVGAIFSMYLLGVYLVDPRRSKRLRAVVDSGSENAYGIYLSQMIWILMLQKFYLRFNWATHVPWPVMAFGAMAVAYLAGFALSAVVARTPLYRIMGRSRASWASLSPRNWFRSPHDEVGVGPLDVTLE